MACNFIRRVLAGRSRQAQPVSQCHSQPTAPPQIEVQQPATPQQPLQNALFTATLQPPQPQPITSPPPEKVKSNQAKPSKIQCRICFTDLEGSYSTPCLWCEEPQCYSCLRAQIAVAIHDHERMPLRCCGRVMHPDVGRGISDPAELDIYKHKYDEYSTPNPFYCPLPTCSTFIPPRMLKPVHGKVICHICNTVSCVKCKDVAPEDHACAKNDTRASILTTFNYKLCPKCGTGIMRMFGCTHVRCQCGAHWCWNCQRPISACNMRSYSITRSDGEISDGRESEPLTPLLEGEEEETDTVPLLVLETPPADTTPAYTTENNPLVSTMPEEASQTQPPTVQEPEVFVNLDDPEHHTWETGSLDFGEEPNDEQWDLWGCQHRFRSMNKDLVLEKWMKDLDLSKDLEVECMKCFQPVKILEKEVEKPYVEENGTENATTAVQPLEGVQKKPEGREASYECSSCGVIYCWRCRRFALRHMKKVW